MLKSVPQMLKKWRIVVHKISKVRQTTCNRIKKILDGATRIVNMFLISWFFYLFLLCSISLLVKYAFILRYEAWVNLWERLVSLKTFLKSAQKQSLSSEICLGSSQSFFSKLASKIPAKFPRNRPFFPRICPWKSSKIWLFFRDLPEALFSGHSSQPECYIPVATQTHWQTPIHVCVLIHNEMQFPQNFSASQPK